MNGTAPTNPAHSARGSEPHGSRHRLLVVATRAFGPDELEPELHRVAGDRETTVRIVAPAVVDSAFQHAAGDVDDGIRSAQERLADSARRLAGERLEIESYQVGDSDPMLAIGDALRTAPADEILIVTHPDDEAAWMEDELFDRARKELDQPITHVSIGDGSTDVERSPAGADEPKSAEVEPPSENLPRIATRDAMGIGIAVLGTVALFAIAANCISEPADTRDAACTAQLLIAGIVALVNIAHVVGLLLFSSVGYRGIAERFISRSSMIGTPLAIVAVLAIGVFA